jgi:hypothetical protein
LSAGVPRLPLRRKRARGPPPAGVALGGALEAMPARIDPPVLFPAPRGGYIDGERFREHDWRPALRAGGSITAGRR